MKFEMKLLNIFRVVLALISSKYHIIMFNMLNVYPFGYLPLVRFLFYSFKNKTNRNSVLKNKLTVYIVCIIFNIYVYHIDIVVLYMEKSIYELSFYA